MAENMKGNRYRVDWLEKSAVIIILIATFFLYTHNLAAESLWRDEGLSYARAMQPVLQIFKGQNVVQGIITPDLHPPGYFLLLKTFVTLGGKSEFVLRLPSVFTAVLAVATVGRLTTDLITKRRFSSTLTMLIVASSPFVYWYAREARMYSLLIFAVALFYWQLGLLMRKQQAEQPVLWSDRFSLGLATLLLVMTHISAVFVVAYGAAVLFLYTPNRSWRIPLIGAAVGGVSLIAVGLTDWGYSMLTSHFAFFAPRPIWQLLNETTTTFSLGGADVPQTIWPVFAVFIVLALIGYDNLGATRWKTLFLTLFGVFGPLTLFYLASLIQPGYSNPRHLAILAVPWLLSIGVGITTLFGRWRPIGLLFCAGVVWLGGSTIQSHQTEPPIVKDQLREIRDYLAEQMLPGDTLMFHQPALTTSWEFYETEELPVISYPRWAVPTDSAPELAEFIAKSETLGRIWFVDSLGRDSNIEDWLDENWHPQKTVNFLGSWTNMSVRLYVPPTFENVPVDAELFDQPLTVGAVEITQLTAHNRPISGDVFWATADIPATGKLESICLRVDSTDDDFITEDCTVTSPSRDQKIAFRLQLPVGLVDGIYHMNIRQADKTSDPMLVKIEGVRLQAADAVWQQRDGDLFLPNYTEVTYFPSQWVQFDAVWQTHIAGQSENIIATWRLKDQRTDFIISGEEREIMGADLAEHQRISFLLPPDALGRYQLQLQTMYTNWRTIGQIEVVPWPIVETVPADALAPADAHLFADAVSLAGYRLNQQGDQLDVTLFWRVEKPLTDDWLVFIHVTEPGQPPVAQTANWPANGTRPTAGWRTGEIIEDYHTITLPDGLTAEQSNIFVGLFNANNPNVRAPLTIDGEPKNDGLLFIDGVPNR